MKLFLIINKFKDLVDPLDGPVIFLASPISGAPDWQDQTIEIIQKVIGGEPTLLQKKKNWCDL